MRFLVYMYYTHPCYQTYGKNCAYCIRIFTVNIPHQELNLDTVTQLSTNQV